MRKNSRSTSRSSNFPKFNYDEITSICLSYSSKNLKRPYFKSVANLTLKKRKRNMTSRMEGKLSKKIRQKRVVKHRTEFLAELV